MAIIIIFILTFVVNATINSIILWFAWNFVMPSVFGLSEISFLSAIGLRLISTSLFGKSDYFTASKFRERQ